MEGFPDKMRKDDSDELPIVVKNVSDRKIKLCLYKPEDWVRAIPLGGPTLGGKKSTF